MGAPLRTTLAILADAPLRLPAPAALPTRDGAMASSVLERLAHGATLEQILLLVAQALEREDAGLHAAIHLVAEGGSHLQLACAPSLSGDFCRAIDSQPIGAQAGSSGTAAYWGERVLVGDLATDALWSDQRAAALREGLRACWSEPIVAGDGRALGAVELYCRRTGLPGAAQMRALGEAATLAGIAIERKNSDEHIARLTNLYRARSEISQFVLQATEESALLAAVCRVAVDYGGMAMAWIGRPEAGTQRMVPLARHGRGLEYLDSAAVLARADMAEGRGPGGRCYRTGESEFINDFDGHGTLEPWRALAARFEFRSVGCVALHRGGGVYAVLGVYSQRKNCFDAQAIALLRQIAQDVGHALEGIDRARQHEGALARLRDSERHFRAYFDRSMVGMAATDREQRWIEVNDALCRMLGYTREELLARCWADVTHPDERAASAAHWGRIQAGETDEYEADTRYCHRDGRTVHVHVAGRVLRAPDGLIDYSVLIINDISDRTRTAQALLDKNTFLDSILRSEPECVAVIGRDNELLQINDAGLKMFGVASADDIRSGGLPAFVLPKYRRPFLELHARACNGGKGVLELQLRAGDGSLRWLELHATPLRDSAELGRSVLFIARDISDKKHSAELIWKQANFDLLTGLANRYMFQDRLAQEIKKARRGRSLLGLLLIDLDHFREINDTLGHETGDALLVAVGQRISASVREAETVARLGGDEFTVILPQLADASAAEVSAQKIITRLSEPFAVCGESIVLSASVGITYFPADATTVDGLLKNADQAMYVAKRLGRNRVGYFTATLQQEAQNRLRVINDLRGALTAGQFRLYFQPIVELATQRICGAEALLRWEHPKRGMVPPAEFIPIAEETGLIVGIGDWAFREAARWAKRWAERIGPHFCVNVNNSPVQFRDPALLLAWPQFLESLQLPGRNMTIEITEGLLLDADAGTTSVLRRLRDSGMRISIDDFGTGYSSLSYLHKFQLDELKIDQSFVRNLQTLDSAKALSESIIVMGHKLGLSVIAEGVEDEAQRDFLRAAGCDCAQGYLYSQPLAAAAFDALLQTDATAAAQAP